MAALDDAQFEALRALGYEGATPDMILAWLQFNGATADATPDAWLEFIAIIHPSTSQRNDGWYQYLGTLGHTGNINDRELLFWTTEAGVIPP